jgi:hypothetical protein
VKTSTQVITVRIPRKFIQVVDLKHFPAVPRKRAFQPKARKIKHLASRPAASAQSYPQNSGVSAKSHRNQSLGLDFSKVSELSGPS